MNSRSLLFACLLATPALAAPPQKAATPRPPPCQAPSAPERSVWPQGTMLWGTAREEGQGDMDSVLMALDLGSARLTEGRLEAAPGTVFTGRSGSRAVKVAVCGGESRPDQSGVTWYRVEAWNERTAAWENPCLGSERAPARRALALAGTWDTSGAHQDSPRKFTFACEVGALAKCVDWGYAPWKTEQGRSLAALHQACTRAVRADYCGNGRTHTRENHPIDVYDNAGVNTRTRQASAAWDPTRASYEGAWGPDGAWCIGHTRHGEPLEAILQECPGRFVRDEKDLGEDDTCLATRPGATPATLLHDRAYIPARAQRPAAR